MNSLLKKDIVLPILNVTTIILLLITTTCGIFSFDTTRSYEIINQYGDKIKMWGSGIYAHDSFFKAPIFIGSDFTILVFVMPMAIVILWKMRKEQCTEYLVRSFGIWCALLYYSASLSFGVTYNNLHLLYITVFGVCFYSVGILFTKLYAIGVRQEKVCVYPFTKGMRAFLLIAGISLFIAWLPDIVTSIINRTSLELIEVYTTEITYVLDMGIISPLMIITLCLLEQKSFIGYVLFRMILKVCMVVGIMLPIQSIFQLFGGISIPFPALITKIFIFVILAVFAVYFEYFLKRKTQYMEA